jgi:hypothetical protein
MNIIQYYVSDFIGGFSNFLERERASERETARARDSDLASQQRGGGGFIDNQ